MFQLRPYQKECIDIINKLSPGSYLVRMATGLGKTIVFTNMKRKGKVLVIAHREELIYQPVKYFNCPVGIEMADKTSNGESVIIASVLSLVRRYKKFSPDEFDTIIIDEAHHAAAPSYKKIIDYFTPRLLLGFTATPKRGDNIGLDSIFSDIIYDKDIEWGIKNNYLSDIKCLRVDIGYSLSGVRTRMGDFNSTDLEKAVDIEMANKAIGDIYKKYAVGQTLVFASSVKHAFNIQKYIKGSYVVTAKTENRAAIFDAFRKNKIKCIINVDVCTEGTDLPNIQTLIMAKPTQSTSAYIQRVGRGLRIHPDKRELLLVDCVGDSGKHNLCTAPSLLGLSTNLVPKDKLKYIQGDLFGLEEKIAYESDVPESWVKNAEYVDLWAQKFNYEMHNINFYQMPDGSLNCRIPLPKDKQTKGEMLKNQEVITIPFPDELGHTYYHGKKLSMQAAIDNVYNYLKKYKQYCEPIWNLNLVRVWGKDRATPKQMKMIKRLMPDFNLKNINKMQASEILNRLSGGYSHSEEKVENEVKVFNDKTFPNEYVILNISATGAPDKDNDIYRVTASKFKNFILEDSFNSFVYSPLDVCREYYTLNHIKYARKLPPLYSVYTKLVEFIGDNPVFAHKMPYITQYLSEKDISTTKIDCYDTEQIARDKFKNFSNYGLDTLASLLLLRNVKTDNIAVDRINLTNELIKCIYKK